MSKKSRRRNKRLLMLAALAGGAAFLGRGKKKFGTDAGFLKSGAAGGASLSSPPIHGTDHIIKKAPVDKVVTNVERPIRTDIYRGSGKKLSDTGQIIGAAGVDSSGLSKGQRAAIMAAKANAPKNIYPPGSVPMQRTGLGPRRFVAKGGSAYKKGGSVTGIAKRGFGRALMKGKK